MYLQRLEYSEEEWAQLEEAASCAQVVKVEVDVEFSDRASSVLAAGFRKSKVVREVTLSCVPEKLLESVKIKDTEHEHCTNYCRCEVILVVACALLTQDCQFIALSILSSHMHHTCACCHLSISGVTEVKLIITCMSL